MPPLPCPSHRFIVLLLIAALLAAFEPMAIGQDAEPDAASAPDEAGAEEEAEGPREVEISVVVSNIRREATEAARRGEGWPRETSNYAADRNWVTDTDDLHTVLLRRLHRNPAIEGYIKWQLLSFEPDFSRFDSEDWQRLIRVAPEPLTLPSPRPQPKRGGDYNVSFFSGRQRAHVRDLDAIAGDGVAVYRPRVGVISSGGIVAFGGREQRAFSAEGLVQLNSELADARRHVRRANGPLTAYRETLLEHIPSGDGLRLAAMLREINERLSANDRTATDLLDHVLSLGEELIPDDLDDYAREALLDWIDTLADRERRYTRAFDTNLRGELVVTTDRLTLPGDKLDALRLLVQNPARFRREHGDGDETRLPGVDGPLPQQPEPITEPAS